METGAQESTVNKKLLALVSVLLVLLLVAICYVGFLIIRSKQSVQTAQQQLAQPKMPLPKSVKPAGPFLPVVVNLAAPPPKAVTVPTSTVWRFVSINDNDFGTFENVGDPSQKLVAKCKDPKRPAPRAASP